MWPLRRLVDEMPESMRQAYGRQNMSQRELNKLDIQDVIAQRQRTPMDTGSGEVQVAIFTQRIMRLASHMMRHHKDTMTKRRLQLLVLQRNRMLKYLRREQRQAYTSAIEDNNIRPNKNFDPTITPKKAVLGTGKKRRKGKHGSREKVPYGTEKTSKGRSVMRKHAARQRRLCKEREDAARAERKAAGLAEQKAKQAAAATPS